MLAPFFGMSMFVNMSEDLSVSEKKAAAIRTSIAVLIIIFLFLFYSDRIQRFLGPKIISILIKTTALILTALAAQIIFTGVRNFATV